MVIPRRGEVYWVDLNPTVDSEIRKQRPCVIVSNDLANRRLHQVTVIPLTSQHVDTVAAFQVAIDASRSGLEKESKALAEQIRTVSKLRLGKKAGTLDAELMSLIASAIKVHLDIS